MENKSKITIKQCIGYLRAKGVPMHMIDTFRLALMEDSVEQADDVRYDRVLTAFAYALYEVLKIPSEDILKVVQRFDDIAREVGNDYYTWQDIMQWLHEETGIICHTNEDNRIALEYVPEDEEEEDG